MTYSVTTNCIECGRECRVPAGQSRCDECRTDYEAFGRAVARIVREGMGADDAYPLVLREARRMGVIR